MQAEASEACSYLEGCKNQTESSHAQRDFIIELVNKE